MAFGVINMGRTQLREDSLADLVVGDLGQYHVNISGQESMPQIGLTALQARAQDITGLQGQFLPVTFSQKPELDGFYVVGNVTATYDRWMPDNIAVLPWSMTLLRAGGSSDLDMESRLSGPLTRTNDHSATGVRWQAPAIGHKAWSAGSTAPGVVDRTSSYGVVRVYRSVPINENPRWGITPSELLSARCRILDSNGFERLSRNSPLPATGWSIDNGLVKVEIASGYIRVSAWTDAAWQPKDWEVYHSTGPAVAFGTPDYCTVLRNDLEAVAIRMTKSLSPGRMTIDLSLRRGGRFVEVYVQHQFGTTLKIVRGAVEAATTATGHIKATAADGAGNKFVLGSSKSYTNDLVNGGISKAATSSLDAFIGVEIASAPTGDVAADLFQQYLGVPAETVQGVSR